MYNIQYHTGAIWLDLPTANLEKLVIGRRREDNQAFSRYYASGSLTFYGEDYFVLKSKNHLGKVRARIMKQDTLINDGYIKLLGRWDENNNLCELTFDAVDEYTELFKVYDETKSITGLTKYTTTAVIDSETKTVEFLKTEYPVMPTPENNYTEGTHTATHWVFVKQLIRHNVSGWAWDVGFTGNDDWTTYFGWSKPLAATQQIQFEFDRCIKLTDILNHLCSETGLNFDNITYSSYLYSDTELRNLYFSEVEYMKLLNGEDKEYNIIEMSLKEAIELMKQIFNLDFYLELGYLKFIHPSQYTYSPPNYITWPAHDITDYLNENWSEQKSEYSHKDGIPYKEIWEVNKCESLDFNGLPIRYEIESENYLSVNTTKYQNNVYEILQSGQVEDALDIKGSYCILACDNDGIIINKAGIIEPTKTLLNGKLSISHIHNDHFKNGGRYLSTGYMNGIVQTFSNYKKIKEPVTINIPADISDFDFGYLVLTDLGLCEIIDISMPLNGGYTKLKLLR